MNPYQKIASQECGVDIYNLVLGRLGQVNYVLEARLGFIVFSWLAWATQLKLSKEMKM